MCSERTLIVLEYPFAIARTAPIEPTRTSRKTARILAHPPELFFTILTIPMVLAGNFLIDRGNLFSGPFDMVLYTTFLHSKGFGPAVSNEKLCGKMRQMAANCEILGSLERASDKGEG